MKLRTRDMTINIVSETTNAIATKIELLPRHELEEAIYIYTIRIETETTSEIVIRLYDNETFLEMAKQLNARIIEVQQK